MASHCTPTRIVVHLVATPATADGSKALQREIVNIEIGTDEWQQRAMTMLREKAQGLTGPVQDVQRLTYEDEEGDWCTLTEVTLGDAHHFALPTPGDSDVRKLEVRVVAASEAATDGDAAPLDSTPQEANAVAAFTASSSSAAATQEGVVPETEATAALVETVLQELHSIAGGINLYLLVPILASAGLRLIEEAQEPALFVALETLLNVKEGRATANDLRAILPGLLATRHELTPERVTWLIDRCRAEAVAVVERLDSAASEDGVEWHANATCGGCQDRPVVGSLYKSLREDHLSLCQKCFDSWQQQNESQDWVRVVADTVPLRVMSTAEASKMMPGFASSSASAVPVAPDVEGEKHGCSTGDALSSPSKRNLEPQWQSPIERALQTTVGTVASGVGYTFQTLVNGASKSSQTKEIKRRSFSDDMKPIKSRSASDDITPTASADSQEKKSIQSSATTGSGKCINAVAESQNKMRNDLRAKTNEIAALLAAQDALRADVADAEERAADSLRHAQEAWAAQANAVSGLEKKTAEVATLEAAVSSLQAENAHVKAQLADALESGAQAQQVATEAKQSEGIVQLKFGPESRCTSTSASVLSCTPFTLKAHEEELRQVDATQDEAARHDVTEQSAELLAKFECRQAFLIGRVSMPVDAEAPSVAASVRVTLVNDGQVQWPETTVLAHAQGDTFGFSVLPLGPLNPQEAAEVVIDLLLPSRSEANNVCSAWSLVDAMTGRPLKPLLLFEACWIAR